jgi:hypothetical protein
VTVSEPEDDNPLVRLRRRMAKSLKGFESGLPEGCDPWSLRGARPDPKLFPVPELVLFALRDVMEFRWSGVGEKVRWSVYVTVEREPFVFELRKFGFAIGHRDGIPPALLKRVEGQLSSSLRLLEPLLATYAKTQIESGNLTLENRMSEFDRRYGYFRALADRAFGPDPEPPTETSTPKDSSGDIKLFADWTDRMNRDVRRKEEGYFASVAMVDAYFSRLEHRVLLLRAFIGRPLAAGDFEAFLEMPWDERLREVANFNSDSARGRLLGRLREVKATIRNPLAHGGIESDGGAFYFHMPRIGTIPANLSRYRGRLRMSFFPIPESTHAEACALFDELDAMLTEGPLKLPNEFVRWGIDPQFDADALARYAEAIAGGSETVEALVERLGHEWERHANMDY